MNFSNFIPMNDPLKILKTQSDELFKKHKVKTAYAFGSVCSDTFNDESDVDLLVSFEDVPLLDYADNFFDLQRELELILGRKIDLVIEKTVTNPYLKKSIDQQKIQLYG